MKRFYSGILLLIIFSSFLQAQGILEDQKRTLFSDEQTYGIDLNNNGIGIEYRYARYIDFRNRWFYEADLDYVKHPKEYKTLVSYEYYNRRFVFGKENLFWELKGYLGRHHEIYSKYDKTSISIRFFYSGGIALGFQKPIYYDILYYNSIGEPDYSEVKKFDPSIHQYNYGGTASFFKGFDELKVIPGITAKTGLNFEYSAREPLVHALEVGIGFSVYPVNIEIMATDEKQYFFFQMYAGYRFGNIVDISDMAGSKTRKEKRQEIRDAKLLMPKNRLLNL